MFVSIVRFCGEKPVSPLCSGQHEFEIGAGRGRFPAEQHAQHAREPAFAARSAPAAARPWDRRRCSLSLDSLRSGAWDMALGKAGLSVSGVGFRPCAGRQIRIGNAEPRQDVALEPVPSPRPPRRLVIVAQKVEKSMHREMGEMMGERLAFGAASRAVVS